MRLDPRDALALVARGPALAEQALLLVPRAIALLDAADDLLLRVDGLIDRIETTRLSADDVIARTDATVDDANRLIVRVAGTVGSVEPTVERAQRLLDAFEPALTKLKPTIDRLAESTNPREVEALVRLVDHLPELVDRVEADIMPMLEGLKTVAPDLHELLGLTRELNAVLAKVPGLGRLRQRAEERSTEGDEVYE